MHRKRLGIVILFCLFAGAKSFGQGATLPWGQPSDQLAWELYAQVNAPSGIPGSKNVEFETWASDADIYTTTPPMWPTINAPKVLQASALGAALAHGLKPFVIGPGGCTSPLNPAAGNFPNGACIGEEVRRNWASFQYIVGNNLYSVAGLAVAAQNGFKVNMPADSVEVKGDWVRVTDLLKWQPSLGTATDIEEIYHTNFVNEGSVNIEYALVAFHFSSKQISNWVWADFEHERNPGRCDDTGCHDSFGAAVADVSPKNSRDANGNDINGNQDYGACAKSAAVDLLLKNANMEQVWWHYCLKGTQITFTNPDGSNTLLGNSVIERINADVPILSSSCMTCHAFASFGMDGSRHAVPKGPIGPFDPAKLNGMTQNDFIWGISLLKGP
jgi:hypothetical protein